MSLLLNNPQPARARDRSAHHKDSRRSIIVDGRRRYYLLHMPDGYELQQRHPVVIVLHGHAGSPERMERLTGMSVLADKEGFVAVYPEGTGWANLPPRSWNALTCCGYALGKKIDDVGFIRALIDELDGQGIIDPKRVYVTGASNGAMMAYRIGCELSDRIAAIAPVAGSMDISSCSPSEPLSVMVVHGTHDSKVPYQGGRGKGAQNSLTHSSVTEAVEFWRAHNRCLPTPRTSTHGRVTLARYGGGVDGAELAVYTIEGGKHTWPGRRRRFRFGLTSESDFSATKAIWGFFSRHSRK